MKILNAQQIRAWDQHTILHDHISSIALMERAANECADWLRENVPLDSSFIIFCGKGNNGGDGLAIARLLHQRDCKVSVHILEFGHLGTEDFQTNLERLHQFPGVEIKFIQSEEHFPQADPAEIIIDALFGSGLNRPLEGVTANLVNHINKLGCTIIAIDAPSGLPVDHSSPGTNIIQADKTLTFQVQKLSFLLQENALYTGNVHILDIGLDPDFYDASEAIYELIDGEMISLLYTPRDQFAHKGNFGHALIVAGSYGKMGAAVLSVNACVRSGAGLTTCHIPKCGYDVMQSSVPEAMALTDFNSSFVTKIDDSLTKYSCVGIGPGLGTAAETKKLLEQVFDVFNKPLVLDADALNLIASDDQLMNKIPPGSILTPHPKEFERLFGKSATDFDRLQLAREKAKELGLVIIVKGHHTIIATPGGKTYFNGTGNAGMAKGGSGDVLLGILTALIGQYQDSVKAAIFGVYLHGLAGDIAAEKYSMEAMTPGDLVENLGEAFVTINAGRTGKKG